MELQELKTLVEDHNAMLSTGKIVDTFTKYYGENVSMQENTDEPMVGSEANLEREKGFEASIVAVHEITPVAVAYGDNGLVMSQWVYKFTHKEWGEVTMAQVAVQQWENGKIVKEQFFHK